MLEFTPGRVILYREPESGLMWPSVYCTDDVAPKAFLRTRPLSYVILILKLGGTIDASNLRWATTTDLNHFDPYAADEDTKQSTPGLHDAYIVALEALEWRLDLDHWKAILSSSDDDIIVIDSDDEFESDEEMRAVIERSKLDFHAQRAPIVPNPVTSKTWPSTAWQSNFSRPQEQSRQSRDQPTLPLRRHAQPPSRLFTPTHSPPRKNNNFTHSSRSSKRPSSSYPAYSDDDTLSPSRRRVTGGSRDSWRVDTYDFSSQSSNYTPSPTFSVVDEEHYLPSLPQQKKSQRSSEVSGLKPSECLPQSLGQQQKRSSVEQGPSATQVYLRNGLKASAAVAPDDDVVEEDLDESNQFVQVFVGPQVEDDPAVDPVRKQHRFQLLKLCVWDRRCFRDTVSARNYFTPVGENTWELQHPRLSEIDPEDFKLVAEFLSNGYFGHKHPDDEEQVANTFAECISTWRTAELLSMDDLLDHIVEKIRATRPWWDMVSVMAFACSVYQSEIPLQAHVEMKNMLSEYIAEWYDIYIEDDHLRSEFMTRLRQLPDLKKHVIAKILSQLDQRGEPHGEEAVPQEEEEVGNDMDLYS